MLCFNFLRKYVLLLTKPTGAEDKCSNLHFYPVSKKKNF